ncbi:MAG TPA: MtrB/PioB family decaheme-associated outer membrane protein [Caldimonas sp.]|nr:MtrB/PioB family decaheme-associated outer membrane protein [Caldimonas sp.]HEX4235686.1 MtrB/PioB family decaheme-associated outer membrane protein [Caldimonas sp.]
MKIFSSIQLLAALGVLGAATAASAQVDTSQWKCTSCPYPKGTTTTGSVDVGGGYVSDSSQKFGDYTGLDHKGGFLGLDGNVSRRSDDGYWFDLSGADLGIDSRRLWGQGGREGIFSLDLGYAEIPRHLSEGAATPFLGTGGNVLTLPAGYPAGDTGSMPLASTLQPIDIGYKYKRLDLGGTLLTGRDWNARVSFRHDERDGTKATSGSFFSSSSQLVAPVNEKTDQAEVSFAYATRKWQATLSYEFSSFRNDNSALTWSNPFLPVTPGATAGQLALAPDNQFQQLRGTAGYDITPTIRISADAAFGRMTQNDAYLPATINPILAPTVPALPAQSLDGKVDTFNGGVKLTAAPIEGVRLVASYDRDRRDNRTPINSYPVVSTDTFLQASERRNTPFSYTTDKFKLNGDYTGGLPWSMRLTGGVDQDYRARTYQEVSQTRETTLWGKAAAQPIEKMTASLKLAHSWRNNSVYGTSIWFGYPENPLLRKFYLADRLRDSVEGHLDYAINEKVSLGVSADYANDDYNHSEVGLTSAKSANLAFELSVAFSEATQGRGYLQSQWVRSQQNGSQAFAGPDWTGRQKDQFDTLGVGIKHAAIPNKLDLGADLTISRSRSDISVDNAAAAPPFPTAKTTLDSLSLYGLYKLKDNLSITGGLTFEHYDTDDWRLDGIAPATIPNLLAFGTQSPHYSVTVLRVALRYRF